MQSTPNEFVLFAVVAALALVLLPTHFLMSMDLFSRIVLQRSWDLAGVKFDQSDLFTVAILLSLIVKNKKINRSFWSIPKVKVWITLGCFLSAAYLLGEENQERLVGAPQALYQLYRYCWKEILYLPLAAMLITSEQRARFILFTLLVAADISALRAIIEGYQGYRTGGFLGSNTVGSAYALPIFFALSILLRRRAKWESVFCWISLLILARGVLFSGSRGSFAALASGLVFFAALASRDPQSRRRMVKVGALVAFAMVGLLALKPNLSQRPTIERALTVLDPLEQDTLQWRMTERWPYFMEIVKANPWFGIGTTPVAEELSRRANTPHQGYLAFATRSGIPALMVAITLIVAGLLAGIRIFRFSPPAELSRRFIALSCSAAIVSILVHNLVETTFYLEVVAPQIWLCTGLMLSWGESSDLTSYS